MCMRWLHEDTVGLKVVYHPTDAFKKEATC